MQVIAFSIFNQKGANGVIYVRLDDGGEYKIIYQQQHMVHFDVACTMLHSNNDVYFDPEIERFRSYGSKTFTPSSDAANFIAEKMKLED